MENHQTIPASADFADARGLQPSPRISELPIDYDVCIACTGRGLSRCCCLERWSRLMHVGVVRVEGTADTVRRGEKLLTLTIEWVLLRDLT